MTPQEANKIISKFMGHNYVELNAGTPFSRALIEVESGWYSSLYSTSLDRLVPVWEKLNQRDFRFALRDLYEFQIRVDRDNYFFGDGKTIQEAAAIATAKAIQELEDE